MAQYEIRLNLRGNVERRLRAIDSLLDKVNAKSKRLALFGPAVPMTGGARYGNAYWNNRRNTEQPKHNDVFYRFRRDLLYNSGSISGMVRNIGNLTNSLGELGRAILSLTPIIKTAISGFGVYVGATAAAALPGAAAFFAGRSMLNSQGMTNALSDRMQLNMARNLLGPAYEEAYRQATLMATTFGFDRSAIMGAISTFTGINTGSATLTQKDATKLAENMGKIAMVGSRPFEAIATNMQQIIAQPAPDKRDIRELLDSAKMLPRIARMMMEEEGVTSGMDVFSYLKNRDRVVELLSRAGNYIELSPVATLRGRIDLARRNMWLKAEEKLLPFWEDLAAASERIFGDITDIIVKVAKAYKNGTIQRAINRFVEVFKQVMNALVPLGNILLRLADIVGNFTPGILYGFLGYKAFGHLGRSIRGVGRYRNALPKGVKSKWYETLAAFGFPKQGAAWARHNSRRRAAGTSAAGGALGGLGFGASIGSLFGPLGTAIGAVVGALGGLVVSLVQAKKSLDEEYGLSQAEKYRTTLDNATLNTLARSLAQQPAFAGISQESIRASLRQNPDILGKVSDEVYNSQASQKTLQAVTTRKLDELNGIQWYNDYMARHASDTSTMLRGVFAADSARVDQFGTIPQYQTKLGFLDPKVVGGVRRDMIVSDSLVDGRLVDTLAIAQNKKLPRKSLVETRGVDYVTFKPADMSAAFNKGLASLTDTEKGRILAGAQASQDEAGYFRGLLTGNGGKTKEIEDLTGDRKALVINFNAPIVEMPTTINSQASADSIVKRIEDNIMETITRGLHLAFNNATRII